MKICSFQDLSLFYSFTAILPLLSWKKNSHNQLKLESDKFAGGGDVKGAPVRFADSRHRQFTFLRFSGYQLLGEMQAGLLTYQPG